MKKRNLILHLPVIHKGYLDFFEKNKNYINHAYVIGESLFKKVSDFKPDIASLKPKTIIRFMGEIGFELFVLEQKDIKKIIKNPIILINDEISRNLHKKFLKGADIEWKTVFLRWDRSSVLSENSKDHKFSKNASDKKIMKKAYELASNSSDWWRQVGAILIKGKRELIHTYNQSLPNDHVPYQVGAARDYLNVGERPDLSNTIHAEQQIIASAAKKGVMLEGSSLYVTHFPCAVCAKIIACSGIKRCYYSEGSSNLDGESVLRSAGVQIIKVKV